MRSKDPYNIGNAIIDNKMVFLFNLRIILIMATAMYIIALLWQ